MSFVTTQPEALTYAANQWPTLTRYVEDGRLTIDNNVSERRLRDQAIGRKNWMFLGSDEAGPGSRGFSLGESEVSLGANIENLMLTGTGAINGIGNTLGGGSQCSCCAFVKSCEFELAER